MSQLRARDILALLVALLVLPTPMALAQDGPADPAAVEEQTNPEFVGDEENVLTPPVGDRPEGWDGSFHVTGTLNLTSNDNVVGQIDGNTILLGAGSYGEIDYTHHDAKGQIQQEWLNTATLNLSWSQTPVVDEFVKTGDLLTFESIYHYFITPQFFGAFARFDLETTILPTEDVRGDQTNYAITKADGSPPDNNDPTTTDDRLRLGESFQPLNLEETAGVFTQPYKTEPLSITLRAGFGGRQTFADGMLIVTDDDSTEDVIEVTEVENVLQAGPEIFATFGGKVLNGGIIYELGAGVFFPVVNNDPQDRDGLELRRISTTLNTSVGIFSWMSLGYHFRLIDDPQLIDKVQIQNILAINLHYTFIEGTASHLPLSIEEQLETAKSETAKERERADKAEQRVRELEGSGGVPAPAPQP